MTESGVQTNHVDVRILSPVLTVVPVAESLKLECRGEPNKTYRLESVSSLGTATWSKGATVTTDAEGIGRTTVATNSVRRFFRLQKE